MVSYSKPTGLKQSCMYDRFLLASIRPAEQKLFVCYQCIWTFIQTFKGLKAQVEFLTSNSNKLKV